MIFKINLRRPLVSINVELPVYFIRLVKPNLRITLRIPVLYVKSQRNQPYASTL